eukprot:1178668-Prorocentrum_minimum.AAC.1
MALENAGEEVKGTSNTRPCRRPTLSRRDPSGDGAREGRGGGQGYVQYSTSEPSLQITNVG